MNGETKLFLGIILATFAIIIGAVFIFSKPTNAPIVDPKVLISADSHKTGSPSATVTMVEFGDFQCPACSAYHAVVNQLMEKNKETLALVFRNYPLVDLHPNALPAARAAEAAGKQGKFWDMYNKIYDAQRDWTPEKDPTVLFTRYAKDMGLDLDRFKKDMESSEVKARIDKDIADANALGVNATPTFFINGEKIQNPASLEDFDALIKAAAKKAPVPTGKSTEGEYHIHANLSVVIDGKAIDFTQPKYQSSEGKELNPNIHFHDGKGDLFHIHKKGMKLADLFASFGMSFARPIKLYVNGNLNSEVLTYEPKDLDRILLVEDTVTNPGSLITSVADDACIYSLKCPERGKPPTEECVGGLGTDCK